MTRLLTLCYLAMALAWFTPAAASAEPDPLAAWALDERFDIARQLYSEYRIQLIWEEDATWSDAELRALVRGAAAVPRAIVNGMPEPVRIRRVHHACLFGVGRYSKGCPTYDRDGNFLLYDLPPLQGEGPVHRLAPLDENERAEIQRRRAAVHALLLAYDLEHEWSDEKRWRQINGWRTRRQAMNRDRWGFSRYLGARSPRLDLVTFAEEWLVRPEDVLDEGRRYTIDRDQSVECQDFSRSGYLAEKFAVLDPSWHPPSRTGLPPNKRCEAFERWADTNNLESIDVLVASATADRPESLYGHLLLHLRYANRSEGFEPVYQFGAVTDTNVDPLTYFSRGLLGGFLSVVELNSFRAVDRIFLQYEQRNLRRYQLMLSPTQKRRFMERLWEYERRFRYPYYFFSNNCASFLIDLIGPSLELDVPERSHFVVAPTDVLDYLARIENPGYGTLLRKRPEMDFSSREIAQQSVGERRDALDALAGEIDAESGRKLRSLDDTLDERDPDERYTTYRAIRRILRNALEKASPRAVELAIDYLYFAGRMERYFAEVMFFRVRQIRIDSLIDKTSYTADELLERRRELYATEDPEARYKKMLDWTEELERKAQEGPHRELTPNEQEEIELARRTDEAFAAVLDTQAVVIETYAPDFDGVAYLEAREAIFVEEQRRRDALAVGPSGKGRIALGGGGTTVDDLGTVDGNVFGSYSFIHERLGEQRRRGFRSDIETRALGLELHVPTTERFFETAQIDATILRFMTIEQKLGAVREGFFDVFGWGADLSLAHDGRRGLDFGGDVSGGLLLPVFTSDHVANHLVLGLWGDGQIDLTRGGRRSRLGADAFARLLLHLGGVYANSLRLEVGSRHWFGFETVAWEWEHRARIATEHATVWVGQYPLILSPWIQGEWTTLDFLEPDRNFRALRAGLNIELPL